MKRIVLISLVAMVFVACKDGALPTDTGLETANFAIFDGSQPPDGNEDVFFLPPLVVDPTPATTDGDFGDRAANPDLEGGVVAKICQLDDDAEPECGVLFPPDLPMVFSDLGQHYRVNWRTRGFDLVSGKNYRIQIFLGATLLAYRDVQPQDKLSGPDRSCDVVDVAFCLFRNGANLPIKVRIETFAGCIAANPDFDPANDDCVTAFVAAGGSFQAGDQAKVTTDDDSDPATFNFETCPDLHNKDLRPLRTDGLVDIPTFGDCVEITTLEGEDVVNVKGTATLCDAFTAATDAGLTEFQAARMTVHRFGGTDVAAVALPHDDGDIACDPVEDAPPPGGIGLNSLERFVKFARNSWRAVSDQVRAWIEPAPLWAKMAVRCNRGGCTSSTGFRSSFMAALPAWMKFDAAETPSDGVFEDVLVGTPLTIKVNVVDSGEIEPTVEDPTPTPVPDAVAGVRLTFTITVGAGTFSGGPCDGATSCTLETDGDGNAAVTTAAVLDANEVEVTGIGVGTAEVEDDDDPVNNVFAARFADATTETTLGVGTLTVTATGKLPDLEITSLDIDQVDPDEDDDLSYSVEVGNLGVVAFTSSFKVKVTLLSGKCNVAVQIGSSKTHVVGGGLSAFEDAGDSEAFNLNDFGTVFSLASSTLSAGDYCLKAEADSDFDIDEVDEGDNVNELEFTVEPAVFEGPFNVLVYGPASGSSSFVTKAGTGTGGFGHTVTVFDAFDWDTATTATFASFDVIAIPSLEAAGQTTTLAARKGAWGPALTGNIVVSGLHADSHTQAGASQYLENALAYAGAAGGTGFVSGIDCFSTTSPYSWVPATAPFVGLTAMSCTNTQAITITDASHPVMAVPNVLTDALLSNWNQSLHTFFSAIGGFTVIATASQPSVVPAGSAAVLVFSQTP